MSITEAESVHVSAMRWMDKAESTIRQPARCRRFIIAARLEMVAVRAITGMEPSSSILESSADALMMRAFT